MKLANEGNQLKIFRKKEGISQKQLAQETGRVQSDISKFESGEYAVPLDLVKHLHIKYKMSYNWYFHRVLPMKDTEVQKPTLVKDVSSMREDLQLLSEKVIALERDLRFIASKVK